MSISITLDDERGAEPTTATAGANSSALVAEASREYLNRSAATTTRVDTWSANLLRQGRAAAARQTHG